MRISKAFHKANSTRPKHQVYLHNPAHNLMWPQKGSYVVSMPLYICIHVYPSIVAATFDKVPLSFDGCSYTVPVYDTSRECASLWNSAFHQPITFAWRFLRLCQQFYFDISCGNHETTLFQSIFKQFTCCFVKWRKPFRTFATTLEFCAFFLCKTEVKYPSISPFRTSLYVKTLISC